MPMGGSAPPPFFHKGPAPLANLIFFMALATALLVVDLRHHTLDRVRLTLATVMWPLQQLGSTSLHAANSATDWLTTLTKLQVESSQLKTRLADLSIRQQRMESIEQENAHLRNLLAMRTLQAPGAIAADVTYAMRDPFSRRVVIDKGESNGVNAGQPVIDEIGLVGQITRVYPQYSEVTLLTDVEQAVLVESRRTGLRAILGGAGDGTLELRFISANEDVKSGDVFVTSGLDGIYPVGLPVAEVIKTDQQSSSFSRILAKPLAGIERSRQVLVLLRHDTVVSPKEESVAAVKNTGRASGKRQEKNSAAAQKHP